VNEQTVSATQNDINIISIKMKSSGGKEVDLRYLFEYISIFEDIYSNGMSGYIKMRDSYNLPETFPIIGEETVFIKFTSHKAMNRETVFQKTSKFIR